MKALFLTNEYPPTIYGGAGVHVDYLTRELAQWIDVEVRCYGKEIREERTRSATLRVCSSKRTRRATSTVVSSARRAVSAWRTASSFGLAYTPEEINGNATDRAPRPAAAANEVE